MSCLFQGDSRELLILAAALSTMLAQDKTPEEIGVMAAFFTIVGDTLALFALQPNLCPRSCDDRPAQCPAAKEPGTECQREK